MQLAQSLVVATLTLCLAEPSAAARPKLVSVGETGVAAPVPAGYVDTRGSAAAEIGAHVASMSVTVSNNVVVFVSRRDLADLRAGKTPSIDRYFVLGTPRSLESRSLLPADFAALRNLLATQAQSKADQAQASVQAILDSSMQVLRERGAEDPVRLKAGYMKELGVVFNRPDSICTLSVSPVTMETGAGSKTELIAIAAVAAQARGRVVTLNIYSSFRATADAKWLRQQCEAWASQLREANP